MISETFTTDLRKMIEGDKQMTSRPLVVGKPSHILSECGANAEQYITITKKVIDKAMRPEIRDEEGRMVGNTGHGLTEGLIVDSIMELESPTMIFKGRQEGFTNVNSIRSLYGRDNLAYFIGENIDAGNLLAANKEKADELLRSIGKSYPEENTFSSFN